MSKGLLPFLALTIVCMAPGRANAADVCTDQMQQEVMFSSLKFQSWQNLRDIYNKYYVCGDDGAIAEAYSDAVVTLFADHWGSLADLVTIADHDPDFEKFALKHIDATTDLNDLKKILVLSEKNCPDLETPLCRKINTQAKAAEAEVEQD